ncbi:MAG: cytidine deaminase [Bacteroidota bacterium]|jgi:cytidine deaminase
MPTYSFQFEKINLGDLAPSIAQALVLAKAACEKAYAPYSHFKVGSAVLLDDGTYIVGSNHENAAYPAGICAERAALSSLDMSDHQRKVEAIVITYQSESEMKDPLSPCGICRQSIAEIQHWQKAPIAIYMCSPLDEIIKVADAKHLLPFGFNNDYLKMD